MDRLGEELGFKPGGLLVKRDDLTGLAGGGNWSAAGTGRTATPAYRSRRSRSVSRSWHWAHRITRSWTVSRPRRSFA